MRHSFLVLASSCLCVFSCFYFVACGSFTCFVHVEKWTLSLKLNDDVALCIWLQFVACDSALVINSEICCSCGLPTRGASAMQSHTRLAWLGDNFRFMSHWLTPTWWQHSVDSELGVGHKLLLMLVIPIERLLPLNWAELFSCWLFSILFYLAIFIILIFISYLGWDFWESIRCRLIRKVHLMSSFYCPLTNKIARRLDDVLYTLDVIYYCEAHDDNYLVCISCIDWQL